MKVKSVLVLASLLLVIILNSCEDSTVNVNGSTVVSGTVRGFINLPLDNVKITINDKSVFTSADGKFSLTGVSLPCDVYVKDSARKHEIIYKNVNTSSLQIYLPIYFNQSLLTNYGLNFNLPAIPPIQKGKLFFMDDEKDICGIQDLPVSSINIQAPPNLTFKGKVYLITYTLDANFQLNDYKYFATKSDVTILPGNVSEVTFTQADLLSVTEDSVSFVLNPPQGTLTTSSFFILNFFNRRAGFYLNYMTLREYHSTNITVPMPTNLPVDFTPEFITLSVNTNGTVNQTNVIPKTGSNVQISLAGPPSVLAPQDNATNVDLNTVFSFQKDPASKVLIYTLKDTVSGISYNLCTSENNITLSMLSPMLTSLIPNSRYNYSIEQVGVNSNNVSEYLRDGNLIPNLRGDSPLRYFTSKP